MASLIGGHIAENIVFISFLLTQIGFGAIIGLIFYFFSR